MAPRKKSLTSIAFDAGRAAQDAAVTIHARLPVMARAAGNPGRVPVEVQDMVSEKVSAALQGALSGSMALGQFWSRALTGRIRTPMEAMQGIANVADAAMRPARIRVRANARRLTRSS